MQRRRRRRVVPRNIFERTTPEARERLAEQISRNNERRQQAIEEALPDVPAPRLDGIPLIGSPTTISSKREGYQHKVLETPSSPPVRGEHDEILSRQTESAISNIEASFELRDRDTGIAREVTGIEDLNKALSELQREDEESFKTWLLEEEIPRLKDDADRLSEERDLAPEEMWNDQEVAHLYRDREVLEYEARKEENNGFLKCFDIRSMDGRNLRALIYLNNTLGKYQNSTHIGDGKIITFKEGVRIVLDSRKTMRGALKGKKAIEALVGPYHHRTCLEWQDGSPSPDWITGLVMLAHNGWPDTILKTHLRGVGRIDINYQLGLWKSKEYRTIEELVKQHYASLGIEEAVHSIEVPRNWAKVIIGTLSKKDETKLIGKRGVDVSNLRKEIKAKMGKNWQVSVQVLK